MTYLSGWFLITVVLSCCWPGCAQYTFNATNNSAQADGDAPTISGNNFQAGYAGPSSFSITSTANNNTVFARSGEGISGNSQRISEIQGSEFSILNKAAENSGSADFYLVSGNLFSSDIVGGEVDGTIVQRANSNEGTAQYGRTAVTGNAVDVGSFLSGSLSITNSASENNVDADQGISGNSNIFNFVDRDANIQIKNSAAKNNATAENRALSGNYNYVSDQVYSRIPIFVGYVSSQPKNIEIKNIASQNYAYVNNNFINFGSATSGNENRLPSIGASSVISISKNNEANSQYAVSNSGNLNFIDAAIGTEVKNIAKNNKANASSIASLSGNFNGFFITNGTDLINVAKNNEANVTNGVSISGNVNNNFGSMENVEVKNVATRNSASAGSGYSISGNQNDFGVVANSSITDVASKNYAYSGGEAEFYGQETTVSGNSMDVGVITGNVTISQTATENIAVGSGDTNVNAGNSMVIDYIGAKRRL